MPAMADVSVRNLRTDIAQVELRAEQIEQAMQFDLAQHFEQATGPSAAEAIRHNVTALLQRNISIAKLAGCELPKAERLIAVATAYRGQKPL